VGRVVAPESFDVRRSRFVVTVRRSPNAERRTQNAEPRTTNPERRT